MLELHDRTKKHVQEFWERTQDPEIQKLFPQSIKSIDQALTLFEASRMPGAHSYGQVIYLDGAYIGDIWVYGIDETDEKMAMLSIVIFQKRAWGQGIGTEAIMTFIKDCFKKYDIRKIGAFTYAHNQRAIGALEKSGFQITEQFVEDGTESYYLEVNEPDIIKH